MQFIDKDDAVQAERAEEPPGAYVPVSLHTHTGTLGSVGLSSSVGVGGNGGGREGSVSNRLSYMLTPRSPLEVPKGRFFTQPANRAPGKSYTGGNLSNTNSMSSGSSSSVNINSNINTSSSISGVSVPSSGTLSRGSLLRNTFTATELHTDTPANGNNITMMNNNTNSNNNINNINSSSNNNSSTPQNG